MEDIEVGGSSAQTLAAIRKSRDILGKAAAAHISQLDP
jgi:hypothetical protein